MSVDTTDEGPAVVLGPLDPRVKVLWWVGGALSMLPWVAAAVAADLLIDLPLPDRVLPIAVAAIAVVTVAVVPFLRYRRWAYAVRDEDLWIQRGLLAVITTVIPFRRLQFVDTRQGPLERMLGLSQLVVHTASPGTSGHLVGLRLAEAEGLRQHLTDLITDHDVI